MKIKLFLILLFSIFAIQAQKKGIHKEIKVKHEVIKEFKFLSDVIKDIPADCKVLSWEVSMVIKGSEKSATNPDGTLPAWLKDSYLRPGTAFFAERIRSECGTKHKSKYKIIVE